MKKAIPLIAVLVLCLSLCACGGGEQNAQTPDGENTTTDNKGSNLTNTEDEEKNQRYEHALSLLNKDIHSKQGDEFKEAYEILTELGDYKDAPKYLSCFTVIPDVLLSWDISSISHFGDRTYLGTNYLLYDAVGRVLCAPRGDTTFYVAIYEHYTYDNNGLKTNCVVLGTPATITCKYENGLLIEEKHTLEGKTALICTYEYDDNNRLVSFYSVDLNGTETNEKYVYENGLLIQGPEGKYEYQDGLLIRKTTGGNYENYIYEDGQLIRVDFMNPQYTTAVMVLEQYTYENGKVKSVIYDEQRVVDYNYGDYYCYTPAE